MRLKKRLFAIAMVLIGILLDASILPFSGLNMLFFPKFALLVVMTIALIMGATQGIIYGTLGGILLDVTLTVPTGLTTALYIVGGLICGWFSHARRRSMLSTVFGPLLALTVYEGVYALYYFFTAQALTNQQLILAVARLVIGVVLVQLLYLLFVKVFKPRRSHYGR